MKQKSKARVKMKLGKIQNISQCCSLARFTKGMLPTHKASLREQAAFNNTIFFLVVCCLIQSSNAGVLHACLQADLIKSVFLCTQREPDTT